MLAMYLHFKELGPEWCCPYNASTISTEHIIGLVQGKTTEFQCLDTEPTVNATLSRSSMAEVNYTTAKELSKLNVKSAGSNKRKKSLVFQTTQDGTERAHSWGCPFKGIENTDFPEGAFIGDKGDVPRDFEMFETPKMLPREAKIGVDSTEQDSREHEENTVKKTCEEENVEHLSSCQSSSDENETEDVNKYANDNWYVTRLVNGKQTKVHIKRALKYLILREWVHRDRKRYHYKANYLPGMEPMDSKHDHSFQEICYVSQNRSGADSSDFFH